MFDVRTLIIFMIAAAFILLIEMIVLARIFPQQRYLKIWILAYFILILSLIGFALRGLVSDFISIVVANSLIIVVFYCEIWASEILIKRYRYRFWQFSAGLILYAILFFYWSDVSPNFPIRVILSSTVIGALSFSFGWIMWRRGGLKYRNCKWIGAFMMTNAVLVCTRMVSLIDAPVFVSIMAPSNLAIYSLWRSILVAVLFGFFVILLALEIDAKETDRSGG